MRVLNSRVFSGSGVNGNFDAMYNDMPIYDDKLDDVVWEGRQGANEAGYGANVRNHRSGTVGSARGDPDDEYEYRDNPHDINRPRRATNTWADDVYDRTPAGGRDAFSPTTSNRSRSSTLQNDYSYSDSPTGKPTRPTAPKPVFRQRTGSLAANQAVALFTFDPDQPGDLGFRKGDIITILKRTPNKTDWWTGRTEDGRTGIFPSNYVETAT